MVFMVILQGKDDLCPAPVQGFPMEKLGEHALEELKCAPPSEAMLSGQPLSGPAEWRWDALTVTFLHEVEVQREGLLLLRQQVG